VHIVKLSDGRVNFICSSDLGVSNCIFSTRNHAIWLIGAGIPISITEGASKRNNWLVAYSYRQNVSEKWE
jgi:hypothetical protein